MLPSIKLLFLLLISSLFSDIKAFPLSFSASNNITKTPRAIQILEIVIDQTVNLKIRRIKATNKIGQIISNISLIFPFLRETNNG